MDDHQHRCHEMTAFAPAPPLTARDEATDTRMTNRTANRMTIYS